MVVSPSSPEALRAFHGQQEGEQYQFHFRQHWIRIAWPLVKMVLWSSLICFGTVAFFSIESLRGTTSGRLILSALAIALLLVQSEFLIRFYRYFLYIIVATDKKIHRIKKSLLLIDDHQTVDLWMLQDIDKSQHGLLQNILGYGSITLEAQETILRIHFTPKITQKKDMFFSLREQARRQMSSVSAAMEKKWGEFAGENEEIKDSDVVMKV